MKSSLVAAISVVAIALSACGMPPPDFEHLSPGLMNETTGAATRTELFFHADFTQEASSALVEGDTVSVIYDESRLPDCRGTTSGNPAWTITGYWQLTGKHGAKETGSFTVAGLNASVAAPSIPLTVDGELSVWFQNNNRWGCNAYDSNFGDNWRFQVQAASE